MIKTSTPIPSFFVTGFILGLCESMVYYKLQGFTVPGGELASYLIFAGIVDGIIFALLAIILKLFFKFQFKRKIAPYVLPSVGLMALATILIIPFGKLSGSKISPAVKGLPNLILITLDTTSAEHLSLYGYHRKTSPNLERIARQGVVFNQAISTSPWTLASHSTMFTGLLPSEHGATYRTKVLKDDCSTLAEKLSIMGYNTAGFISGPYCKSDFGISQGFSYYDDQLGSLKGMTVPVRVMDKLWGFVNGAGGSNLIKNQISRLEGFLNVAKRPAEKTRQRVCSFMQDNTDMAPFFLFINFFDPHEPYIVPGEYEHAFNNSGIEAPSETLQSLLEKTGKKRRKYYGGYDVGNKFLQQESKIRELTNSQYDALILYMDTQLGILYDYLEQNGYLENTYIIITSDHGESIGEHRSWGHCSLYDEVLWVPLVVIGPDVPSNVEIDEQVSTLSIYNSLLSFTEGDALADMNCLSYYWENTEAGTNQSVVFGQFFKHEHHMDLYGEKFDRDSFMCRTPEMKLIYRTNEERERYDLAKDQSESVNIINGETEKYTEIDSLFQEMIEDALNSMTEAEEFEVSSTVSDQLRAVGYIK